MELIADGLLIATALVAGLYCLVLSRRMRRLTDTGSGIGAQIAALDRAMAETRAALGETREGVSELRASARAAIADLKRRTEDAEELAARLGGTAERAEETLARLYAAEERIEAHERRAAAPGNGSEPGAGPSAPSQSSAEFSTRESVIVEAAPKGGEETAAEAPGAASGDGNGAAGRRHGGAARRGKNGKG